MSDTHTLNANIFGRNGGASIIGNDSGGIYKIPRIQEIGGYRIYFNKNREQPFTVWKDNKVVRFCTDMNEVLVYINE